MAPLLLLLSLTALIQGSVGFSTSRTATPRDRTRRSLKHVVPLNSEVQTSNPINWSAEDDDGDDDAGALPELTGSLANSRLLEYELTEHKPLGCSVEESLADEPDGAKYVFVAEITSGGNAVKAGLRQGDVIVQLSGTFDEVVDVAGLGIEKIKSLVAGRSDERPLKIRVARGSDVRERHELALVELCIIGDDAATAECIASIYSAENDMYVAGDDDAAAPCDEDDETECMLDSMWSDWSDGLVEAEEDRVEEEAKEEKKTKKVAQPWASRSSPSGTYVRDPKTGKLVNIDE